MASEKSTATVHVQITNAVGIGYSKGKVYEVTPEEAKRLVDLNKAKVVSAPVKENAADAAPAKAEKAVA
jgi:hypothetical protein